MKLPDADDIIAILETGPQTSAELVALFETTAEALDIVTRRMVQDGQLRRVGTSRRLALASWIAKDGRPPTVNRQDCRRAILERVNQAPLPMRVCDIVLSTGLSKRIVRDELPVLLERGELEVVGRGNATRYQRGASGGPFPPSTSEPAVDRDGDDDLDTPEDADFEDPPLPPRRNEPPKYQSKLRQLPQKATVSANQAPAWWTTAPRNGFTKTAETEHAERMAKDPVSRSVNPPMLGSAIPMRNARYTGGGL